MADFTCEEVDDLFQRETGRFSVDIFQENTYSDPWQRLVKVGNFPKGMGTTINVATINRIQAESFEDDWNPVSLSDGIDTNVGCNPEPTELEFGQTVRNYSLFEKSYITPCVCLDDLKSAWSIQEQVRKTLNQLGQQHKTVISNRRRSEYQRLVPKFSTGADAIGTLHDNLDDTFPVPTRTLSQALLNIMRLDVIRNGGFVNALGMGNGVPILGLVTSPETSDFIIRENDSSREDLRFAKPSELVAPLGVERDYRGLYHLPDFEAPRYDYNPGGDPGEKWIRRHPWKKVNTSKGVNWIPNPDYAAAQYEMSFIYHPDVYREDPDQVGPDIPDASFQDYPHYYTGQFFWLNIISKENPLGRKGQWLSIYKNGSMPIKPFLGRGIMHLRCPNDLSLGQCSYYYAA